MRILPLISFDSNFQATFKVEFDLFAEWSCRRYWVFTNIMDIICGYYVSENGFNQFCTLWAKATSHYRA